MTENSMIGFRIYLNTPRPAPEIGAGFRQIPTGLVCDAMDRMIAMDYRIRPLDPTLHLSGPALTVRTRPGDNLMVWKAIDVAKPGDVLVIATYAHTAVSTFGELFALAAQAKGLAGIVCDGMCRDVSGIRATGLPTFALGSVPSSPGKDGPGEIGGPIACGGIAVHAGDIIVGDEDGLCVVPMADGPAVLQRIGKIEQKERNMLERIESGRLVPELIDEVLASKSCEYIS